MPSVPLLGSCNNNLKLKPDSQGRIFNLHKGPLLWAWRLPLYNLLIQSLALSLALSQHPCESLISLPTPLPAPPRSCETTSPKGQVVLKTRACSFLSSLPPTQWPPRLGGLEPSAAPRPCLPGSRASVPVSEVVPPGSRPPGSRPPGSLTRSFLEPSKRPAPSL